MNEQNDKNGEQELPEGVTEEPNPGFLLNGLSPTARALQEGLYKSLIVDLKRQLRDRDDQITELRSQLAMTGTGMAIDDEVSRRFKNLFERVHPAAQELLGKASELRQNFDSILSETNPKPLEADVVVLSIDIRRSTDLMLLAESNQGFSKFMTTLCRKMQSVITHNFGIYDKFTGDGILAFFPDFFAGKYRLVYALNAALACQKVFENHYYENIGEFSVVISEAGIGAGIDAGPVAIVPVAEGLTVVGRPVVFACRLNSSLGIELNGKMEFQLSHLFNSTRYVEGRRLDPEWNVVFDLIDHREIKNDTIRAIKVEKLEPLTRSQYRQLAPQWFKSSDRECEAFSKVANGD